MKKELIISKIETSQEGSPYIYLVLTDTRSNFTPTRRHKDSLKILFGVAAIPITSSDDLKNLPKKIYDVMEGAFSGGSSKDNFIRISPSKTNPSEYKQLGIKIGDKITLEIKRSNNYNIGA